MPLVSFVTPSLNRADLHEQLYAGFDADLLPEKELVVLDESQEPSPFFSQLQDPRVRYFHEPMKKAPGLGVAAGALDKEGVTHIGRARNRLVGLARGEFIAHRDDDDFYDPRWGTFALERLGGADLFKLVRWRSWHEASGLVFEWDACQVGGKHYAVKGSEYVLVDVDPADLPPQVIDAWKCGFGFSLFGPRRTFEALPFEEDGTEDIPFVRSVVASGGKVVFCDDGAHLVLHRISPRADSVEYPQKIITDAGVGSPALRDAVRGKMVGLMGAMHELPSGKPIRVQPGVDYAVLVSVADKHTLKSLATAASKWGVRVSDARDNVEPAEFGIHAPPPGYRLVHASATVDVETEMPWKLPAPLSAFDKTSVVRAWSSAPPGLGAVMKREGATWSHVATGPFIAMGDRARDVKPGEALTLWRWNGVGWVDPMLYEPGPSPAGLGAATTGPITTYTPDCPWVQLPDGQDIGIDAGYTYSAIVSLSKSYSKSDIVSQLGSNFTLLDYEEQGQNTSIPIDSNSDHRTVVLTIQALKDGSDIPWKSPWPTTIFNIVHAWYAAPANACASKAPVPVGTYATNPLVMPVVTVLGLTGAAGLGWWWWARGRKPAR